MAVEVTREADAEEPAVEVKGRGESVGSGIVGPALRTRCGRGARGSEEHGEAWRLMVWTAKTCAWNNERNVWCLALEDWAHG